MIRTALVLTVCAVALTACDTGPEAPTDVGMCYHAVPLEDGKVRFNEVKKNVASIELCAAELEGMRQRFLSLGGRNRELIGAYQGSFIILDPSGIYRQQNWNGARYLMLERTGDGRLARPGAFGNPTP